MERKPVFPRFFAQFPLGIPRPDHINRWPERDQVDPNKFRVEETYRGVIRIFAAEIETVFDAELIREARERWLESHREVVIVDDGPKIKLGEPLREQPINSEET